MPGGSWESFRPRIGFADFPGQGVSSLPKLPAGFGRRAPSWGRRWQATALLILAVVLLAILSGMAGMS